MLPICSVQAASFQGTPLELSYWVSHNLPLQVGCKPRNLVSLQAAVTHNKLSDLSDLSRDGT